LGDLGISVKLDVDDKEGNDPRYYGKGLTSGYTTKLYAKAYNDSQLMTKKDLFEND
jgi:hypothetical protein